MNDTEPQEVTIVYQMKHIFPPMLLALGIPGNILSLIILTRLRRQRGSLYLAFLAVVDLFVLCVGLLINWIGLLTETDIRDHSEFVCKSHIFAVYYSFQISSWTLVLITSERACSMIYPHRVRTMCTKARGLTALATMLVCFFCLNSHFFFGFHLEFRPRLNKTICICKEEFEHFVFKVWPWIDFLFVFLIPCLFLIVGNVLILRKIRINQRFSDNSTRQRDANNRRANTVSFLTKMTISLSSVFIVCISPISIISIGQSYWWPPETTTKQDVAKLRLVWTTATMIMYINNTVNFLLYMMLGSKFRRELGRMFTPVCFKTKRHFTLKRFSQHLSTPRSSVLQTTTLGSISEIPHHKKQYHEQMV